MKYNPKEIADKVNKLMKENYSFSYACQMISRKTNVRIEDIKMVTILNNPELYNKWLPNRRRIDNPSIGYLDTGDIYKE